MNEYHKYINPIKGQLDEMVAMLMKWATINSHSYNFKGLEDMRKTLRQDFSILPAKIEEVSITEHESNLYALRAVCRPQAPIQVFLNGHMDTVYDREHAFQKCRLIDDSLLEGPGVADMKGGLLVMLKALEAFEKCPWKEKVGWQVFISPDEEVGSLDSDKFFKEAAGGYNIGLLYESSPMEGTIVRARRGSGNFTVRVHGKEAHAGRDFDKGRNAIIALAKFLEKFNKLNDEFEHATFNVGYIDGGGPVNVVPFLATAKYNIRFSYTKDRIKIEKRIGELINEINSIDGIHLEHDGVFTRPPKEVTPAIEHMFESLKSCGADIDMKLEWADTGGAADGNNLADHGLPNIDNLGVVGAHIHSSDELILIDSLWQRAQLSALFLMKLAKGDILLPENIYPNFK